MEKYQTLVPRFFAILVDNLIVWGIIYLYENFILNTKASITIAVMWTIITLIFANFYNIYLTYFYGQTLGKMLMKVKVVDISEIPVTFFQVILRRLIELLLDVSSVTAEIYIILTIGLDGNFSNSKIIKFLVYVSLFLYLIEILVVLCNQKHRSLHDYIAGTVVIRTNELPT